MSEREQVCREQIEWQQWSRLTVHECCEAAGASVGKTKVSGCAGINRFGIEKAGEIGNSKRETQKGTFYFNK